MMRLLKGGAGNFLPAMALALCAALTGCQSQVPSDGNLAAVNPLSEDEIILTVPVRELADYDQLMVLKLSEILDKCAVDSAERAQLFYELGIVYDRMGLDSSARVMFMNAIFEKPDFAPAYDFMGVYLASAGHFQDAYEAFDSALELARKQGQKRIFTYFSRAIALYYGERAPMALADFERDYAQRRGDPYRLLWGYILESEVYGEKTALEKLAVRATDAAAEQQEAFGMRLVDYVLGRLSEEKLLDQMRDPSLTMQERIERVCEGYFYLGKAEQIRGRDLRAFWFYHLAVATEKYDFLEHRYARLEIERLARKHSIYTYAHPTVLNTAPAEESNDDFQEEP